MNKILFTAAGILAVWGLIMIRVAAAEPELRIESETFEGDSIVYTLSSDAELSGVLVCAAYNSGGMLCGMTVQDSPEAASEWTIAVTAETEEGMSKMFFWDSMDGMRPRLSFASSNWNKSGAGAEYEHLTTSSTIGDLLSHPAFSGFAEQILPWDGRSYDESMELSDMAYLMPYHSHVDPQNSVDALNRLIDDAAEGKQIFYDFYSDEEKAADPSKEDTGLFFYRGEPGKPFAVQCAGGGFSYVGSLHESMPHCVEVNKHGYNAFAIKYRVGGEQRAAEDLAAAISFIIQNAETLGVSAEDYSVWCGSAGARMAADMGSYGTAYWGGEIDSRPATVVFMYTGRSDYTPNDPPTFVGVGENDGIANPDVMKRRADALAALGIDVEFHLYPNLGHGFGIGLGTSAEDWVDDAVAFWERHIGA